MNNILFGNNNKVTIKKITKRELASDKKRNFFIIAAIMLTTLMITSVFSIGISFYESINMREKRMQGSISEMAFAAPTNEQLSKIYTLDYVKTVGVGALVAQTNDIPGLNDLDIAYVDKAQWEDMFSPTFTNIVGYYPKKENEIMLSRYILNAMGIANEKIGMEIPISFVADNTDEIVTKRFVLSCIYTEYIHARPGGSIAIYCSHDFAKNYNALVAKNTAVNIIFKDSSHVRDSVERLKSDLPFYENQPYVQSPAFDDNYGSITTYIALSILIIFLMFTGYLLIYNVMYISVAKNVRFFGMLKTIGTTPNQVWHIVVGQVLSLCVIGIPIGCLVAAVISLLIVPVILTNSGVDTGTIVSFSPVIYLGAAFFALVTALLGAITPAKRAARITPIEALHYTGSTSTIYKPGALTSAKGKLYKMALRNIFRDSRRATIVILSLFIGITIFTTVMTIVTSLDIDNAVNAEYNYDYSLSANTKNSYYLSDDFVNEVKELDGLVATGIITIEPAELMYSDKLGRYIDWICEKDITSRESVIVNNAFAWDHGIKGIDSLTLKEINKTLQIPIDTDAFERGEIALINISYYKDMEDRFTGVSTLEIKCSADENPIQIMVGGVVSLRGSSFSYPGMEILVSNDFMQKHYTQPRILSLDMNVENGYDKKIYNTIEGSIDKSEVVIESRYAARKAMQEAKMIMYVLGGGISCILGLIGIFNFVNVMSVGIMVRKREFATLESIGMSNKQMHSMLRYEGIGYAIIPIICSLTLGNLMCYVMFRLFKNVAVYAKLNYPIIPVFIIYFVVLLICCIIPEIEYRDISKNTLVERLRQAE